MRSTAACILSFGFCFSAAAKTYPIQHVIVIMQENRSFDEYFGTFPGANGIPPGTCMPLNPSNPSQGCVVPFHDVHDINAGGPHTEQSAEMDLDDGVTTNKLDGFVYAQSTAKNACSAPATTTCHYRLEGTARHDVMGYHNDQELPNYWAYAKQFVLQDNLYAGVRSWSWPSHIDMTSEWVATCTNNTDASTCITNLEVGHPNKKTNMPWANLFQLMDVHGVSWKYYLGNGDAPDCEDGEMDCPPSPQTSNVQSIWNPPGYFGSVKAQGSAYLATHNPSLDQFYVDVANNALPQVSWIVGASLTSEHPVSGITTGEEFVTALVNAIANSPYWNNTAIFVAWDEWGGFYDHVVPPVVDMNTGPYPVEGFGVRVPGLLISAYAKKGYIDHSVLSFASYATFFEDLFMDGARLDPAALGIPDARPDIRDALTSVTFPDGTVAPIGNLMDEFAFNHKPQPPLILSSHIPTGIAIACRGNLVDQEINCTQPTVNISWTPVTSAEVPGPFTYHVVRDGKLVKACTGTASSCVDTPGSGAHFYSVYSIDATGVHSPNSAAAEADEP
jgi:phospholipase C